MLFAELSDTERLLGWVVAFETAVGIAAGLWFGLRRRRRDDRREESAADIEDRKQRTEIEYQERQRRAEADYQERQHDVEGLLRVIGVLERNEAKVRAAYDVLQAGVTEKLIVADRAFHESERQRAALEERLRACERRNRELDRRLKHMEDPRDDDPSAAESTGG